MVIIFRVFLQQAVGIAMYVVENCEYDPVYSIQN